MEAVSRSNIYVADPEPEAVPNLEMDLVEVEVSATAAEPEEEDGFCLFGGETIQVADLEAVEEPEELASRPLSYYFYKSSPSKRSEFEQTAILGENAAVWVLDRETTAPDVNAHYLPKKRRCRPGSSARKRKLEAKHAAKAEKQAAARAYALSRRRNRR